MIGDLWSMGGPVDDLPLRELQALTHPFKGMAIGLLGRQREVRLDYVATPFRAGAGVRTALAGDREDFERQHR